MDRKFQNRVQKHGEGFSRRSCRSRRAIDFIYYAHFESHTIDSLTKLQGAWVTFHQNLQYFVEKEVRKSRDHFNIPKLHSMQHYIASIISRGSADGYSTERLHIDFAKSAYRATNKTRKIYIHQMTKWLTRQESCYRFLAYLQWVVPGYCLELSAVSESKEDDDEDEIDLEDQDTADQTDSLGYSVAKHPAPPYASSTTLALLISSLISPNFLAILPFAPHCLHSNSSLPPPSLQMPYYCPTTTGTSGYTQSHEGRYSGPTSSRCSWHLPSHTRAADTVLARESNQEEEVEHPLDGTLSFCDCLLVFTLIST